MNTAFSGRWDRNRTCTLRFWSTRRAVQTRPRSSNLPRNSHFLATHRPGLSKNVQPVCSQFCSQGRFPERQGNRVAQACSSLLKGADHTGTRRWQSRSTSVHTSSPTCSNSPQMQGRRRFASILSPEELGKKKGGAHTPYLPDQPCAH
jgi:hypothetical protein